jgi:hypothetical protein
MKTLIIALALMPFLVFGKSFECYTNSMDINSVFQRFKISVEDNRISVTQLEVSTPWVGALAERYVHTAKEVLAKSALEELTKLRKAATNNLFDFTAERDNNYKPAVYKGYNRYHHVQLRDAEGFKNSNADIFMPDMVLVAPQLLAEDPAPKAKGPRKKLAEVVFQYEWRESGFADHFETCY